MTVAQLKRHMDRRFDHLERTKADKSDLSRFATKDDLRRFATKDDLKRFATKDDLKRFATKDDLKRFATKDDLKRFATKDDLNGLATRTDYQFAEVFRRLDSLNDKIDSVLTIVRDDRDHFNRVVDEHDHRISDLERQMSGQQSLFPSA
jgi:hypothetical protein